MCMVSIDENIVQDAIRCKIVTDEHIQQNLSEIFENYLKERIAKNQRKQILQFEGSGCWEGNLDEMREGKWENI